MDKRRRIVEEGEAMGVRNPSDSDSDQTELTTPARPPRPANDA